MLLVHLFLRLGLASPVPYADDPVIYPPEVFGGEDIGSGEIRVTTGDGMGALLLEHTSVVAEVHAGMARLTLIQWFRNPYGRPVDATYLLPLPEDAAVDSMDMTCGDRLIEGIIMERKAARAVYDQARAEGRKAALLDQERENLFTQHIAGLCPDEEVQITLQAVVDLPREDGDYTLTLPTTVGQRFHPPWVSDPERVSTPYARTGRTLDVTVYIEEGMPVSSLWSDTHDFTVTSEDDRGATIELTDSEMVPNRDLSLSWSLEGTEPRASALLHRPDPSDPGYFSVSIEPQVLGDLFEARPRELIFVIDGSGSMKGEPFELARQTVARALDEMAPYDTFNLVRFSNGASPLYPRAQPSTPQTRAQAVKWLQHFEGGGTQLDDGLRFALRQPTDPEKLRLLLLITDGYVSGEGQTFRVVRDELRGARLFSLGVGGSPNRFLLAGVAEMGRGTMFTHPPGASIDDTVDRFYDRIAHPAMSDIELEWTGLQVTEQYPTRIPDLWAGQPIRVVGRYSPTTGEAPPSVQVAGVVGSEAFTLDLPLTVAASDPRHSAVATLWARRKIRDLEWYPGSRSTSQVRHDVIEVALEHSLMSRYTSLVAVDDRPSACGPADLVVKIPHEPVAQGSLAGSAGVLGSLGTKGRGGSGYGSGAALFSVSNQGSISAGLASGGTRLSVAGSLAPSPAPRPIASKRVGSIAAVACSPIVMGSLDKSLIDDVIKRNRNRIRYAYERQLRANPSMAGKLTVRFVIGADGNVQSAEIRNSTVGDEKLEKDIERVFERMTFPKPKGGGTVIVTYPLVFSSGG